MHVAIRDLLPTYFETNRKSSSDIWGKDLHFNQGEYIKIVAPSGSGKTSLMHFLYGLRNEYSGSIYYDEAELKKFTPEQFAVQRKERLSIIFQDLRLFPERTAFENIEIKRQLHPYHPVEKTKEMCERLGISSRLQTKCRICSYGEQQRIAIIRALMQPFDFLLLDEPFSHLDDNNAAKALELMLEETKQRGAAIIFADLERVDAFPYNRIFHL